MELLSPAGSIGHGLEAIKNGADAVYFGLEKFSARRSAVNFSFDDARVLKQTCMQEGVSLYCTLNTIITEEELAQVRKTLHFLEYLEVDGIIVQDFAVPMLCKEEGIKLNLHASTQMAVHGPDGASFLADCGFTRIVLARELTIPEIRQIHLANPVLELEVFIHGAMCYSLSGNCFASSCLTGRSGNRGECAQICRTWFEKKNSKGYYFSAADLARKESIPQLADAGVCSLKIEGRMKSPSYAAVATAYYRKILDEKTANGKLEKRLKTAFARNWWPGFSENAKTGNIDAEYAGHKGLKVGRVLSWQNGKATVLVEEPLQQRDGVLFFGEEKGLKKPFRLAWPFRTASGTKSNKVTINIPTAVSGDFYKISAHDDTLKQRNKFSGSAYWKKPLDLDIEIHDKALVFSIKSIPPFTYPAEFEQSTGDGSFEEKLKQVLQKSGQSYYRPGTITIRTLHKSGSRQFLPPSVLKKLKNKFYSDLTRCFLSPEQNKTNSPGKALPARDSTRLKRSDLNPKRNLPLPFISSFELTYNGKDSEIPASYNEFVIYPLRPVNFDEDEYKYKLNEAVSEHMNAGKKVLIGLNNPAHLAWARELGQNYSAELEQQRIGFFIDYALCSANSKSYEFLHSRIPGLRGMVPWIEGKDSQDMQEHSAELELILEADKDFTVPFFTSRHCFFASIHGCTGCSRNRQEEVLQNGKRYLVLSEKCLNYLVPL